MKKRNLVLMVCTAMSCSFLADRNKCTEAIKPRHNNAEIEQIVADYNTPYDAYDYVARNIEFVMDDTKVCGCEDRWSSLQETLAFGKGDCEDGALSFAALLSDNPEYQVKIIMLWPSYQNRTVNNSPHTVAAYNEGGKWGYASFNDTTDGGKSVFRQAVFESLKEAMRDCGHGFYDRFYIINFAPDEIKYGQALQKKLFEKTEKIPVELKE